MSQNHESYSQDIENSRHCQVFVYNADEVSLDTLLDPNFRPMETFEQQQQQQQHFQQFTYPCRQRSSSTRTPIGGYKRASFDPMIDLPTIQTISAISTRRRHPVSNDLFILRL